MIKSVIGTAPLFDHQFRDQETRRKEICLPFDALFGLTCSTDDRRRSIHLKQLLLIRIIFEVDTMQLPVARFAPYRKAVTTNHLRVISRVETLVNNHLSFIKPSSTENVRINF